MLKRFCSVFIALSMLCSLASLPVFALDLDAVDDTIELVEQDGYTFRINEQVDEYFRLIRSYEKESAEISALEEVVDLEETKALLIALGMDESTVEDFSDETLEGYANSVSITVTTSYLKVDEDGDAVYLPKETALEEAAQIKEDQLAYFTARASSAIGQPPLIDEYMKLTYEVANWANGRYHFSTDATWLTMPWYRGTDSIGSCAMNFSIDNSTRKGTYDYKRTLSDYADGTVSTTTIKGDLKDFKNASNGNWYGSAAYFTLPYDVEYDTTRITYSGYHVHYDYCGLVCYPELISNFSTVGSYAHSKVHISGSPSISITMDPKTLCGEITASIGLDISKADDIRAIEYNLQYVPR